MRCAYMESFYRAFITEVEQFGQPIGQLRKLTNRQSEFLSLSRKVRVKKSNVNALLYHSHLRKLHISRDYYYYYYYLLCFTTVVAGYRWATVKFCSFKFHFIP